MSNAKAIAAVTATLQAILGTEIATDPDLNDTTVTALPLDKARGTITSNQLNLFLYQVLPNAAWRNADMPTSTRPGERGNPPLALDLHYLITAFGRENDTSQPFDHHLLGKAMSVLYDHALLGPDEIRIAFPGSDVENQPDRVRITFQPLSLEDISKLWMGFATQYRVSVGYDVSVTLIESTQAPTTALPVLARAAGDKGWTSQSNLNSPLPGLTQIAMPNRQTSARLGDALTLTGANLDGTDVVAQFNHPRLANPITVDLGAITVSNRVNVQIPNQPTAWPAGIYSVGLLVQKSGEDFHRTTNQLALELAPKVTVAPAHAPAGTVTYTATCSPEILPGQAAFLLLGGEEIAPQPFAAQTDTLTFIASNLGAGSYFFRLRVDGVDSLLVNRATTPPTFDMTQQVSIP
jgi:uncharacterized protein DUF4255